jgi:hypothetical protein
METKLSGSSDLLKAYNLLELYQELTQETLNKNDFSKYTKDIIGKIDYTPRPDLKDLITTSIPRKPIKQFTQEELDAKFSNSSMIVHHTDIGRPSEHSIRI